MPNRWPITNGNWSNAATWSGSLIPTAADDVFANNFNVNIDTSFEVLSLRNTASGSVVTAGGSFIFNSGSISGSATSTTAALTAGATNLIQVTATTGTVTLNVSSSVTGPAINPSNLILHSGNCDFNLNGQNFTAASTTNAVCINKSSAGTITVRGNIFAGAAGTGNSNGITSTNGNTIVIGNVVGGSGNSNYGIDQSVGNVTVTGNVTGGTNSQSQGIRLTGAATQFTIIGNVTGGTTTNAFGISHSGTSGSVIGNVTGGSGASAHGINTVGAVTVTGTVTGGAGSSARGINNTAGTTTVTGNVTGNVGDAIVAANNSTVIGNVTAGSTGVGIGQQNSTSNLTITITGTVAASSTAIAVGAGGGTGNQVVNLTGNMINVSGRQAIFTQNLFISNAATSQWRLFTQGGQDKTLYSADTFPNQPSSANVRSGSFYGPANALSGSMVVPAPSNVRVGVLTDNTVGTGQSLTAADFLAAISSSADPFAQRLRNVATVDTVGSLVTGLNGGF